MRPSDDRLSRYLDGALSEDDRARFLDDLAPDARREVEALEWTLAELASLPMVEPPEDLTPHVLGALPATRASRWRRWLSARPLLGWQVAGAALAAAVALIVLPTLEPRGPGSDRLALDRGAGRETRATVRFSLRAPDAGRVSLAGSFNSWRADDLTMVRSGDGVWTIDVPLAPGRHEYMFVVDGERWIADPLAPSYEDDGFGRRNAVLQL